MVDLPNHVIVGNYCSIASRVRFMDAGTHLSDINHNCVFTTNWEQPKHPLPIEIGNDVWIGEGAVIFEGVKIGDGSIIGAYSVVRKNIPPFSVIKGNPAKIVRTRFTPEQIEKLNKIKWWNWTEEVAKSRIEDMKDIDIFLEKYAI